MATVNFVVDRSTWRCGKNGPHAHFPTEATGLKNAQDHKCCLGFMTEQAYGGVSCCLMPLSCSFVPRSDKLFTRGLDDNSKFAARAAKINDHPLLTRWQREMQLERLAEEFGLRITFVGEYTDVLQ